MEGQEPPILLLGEVDLCSTHAVAFLGIGQLDPNIGEVKEGVKPAKRVGGMSDRRLGDHERSLVRDVVVRPAFRTRSGWSG
jgi:hypothetical protein